MSSRRVSFGQDGQGGGGPGQPGGRQRMSPEERVAQRKTQLGLNADQVTKITAILQKQRDSMQALRDKYGDDREGMREEMRVLRESTDKEIAALLNDVQKKKYTEIQAQRRGGPGGRGGEQAGPGGQTPPPAATDTAKGKTGTAPAAKSGAKGT